MQDGWTLIELIGASAVLALVLIASGRLAVEAARSNQRSAAYSEDLGGARRALRALERDLRAAQGLEIRSAGARILTSGAEITWSLEGGELLRHAEGRRRVLARRVAALLLTRDEALVHVHLMLKNRRPGSPRPVFASSIAIREARR
ncbi:MAG: type II secretion system protein J [Planctomycetota bacterium]